MYIKSPILCIIFYDVMYQTLVGSLSIFLENFSIVRSSIFLDFLTEKFIERTCLIPFIIYAPIIFMALVSKKLVILVLSTRLKLVHK